ncbi:MAG: GntR family transcriptional regulator [Pseudomonadota bacterium]
MTKPPPSLADHIKAHLVQQIADGTLEPGDRLIELQIAKEAGTSQAPVREALRALEASGLIEFRRNRGAVVRQISAQELVEIYAVRAELEGFAVQEMAKQTDTGSLGALCDQMDAAAARGDISRFATLNTQFHRDIVQAAGNQTLLALWETLDIQTRTIANIGNDASTLPSAIAQHRAIVAAISNGDADDARALMVEHINSVVG